MRRWIGLGALAAGVARAAPLEFEHRGRLTGSDGRPLVGTHNLAVTLYDASGTAVWAHPFVGVPFDGGYYSIRLGEDGQLDVEDLASGALFLGLAVDGSAELPIRTSITGAPYVGRASSVQLGAVSSCDPTTAGTLRYTGTEVQVCDGTGWEPAIADQVAPSLSSRAPAPGATAVSRTTTVTATFDEPVVYTGSGFQLVNATTSAVVPASVTASGSTVTLTPSGTLDARATYSASIAASSVRDAAGNFAPAVVAGTWTFTTQGPPTFLRATGSLGTILASQAMTPVDLQVSSVAASYSCAISSGALPPGVSLAASTCVLSGTPSNPGTDTTYAFNVAVTDVYGTATAAFSLLVDAPSTQSQAFGTAGSATFTVPAGVTSLSIKAWGGGGGGGTSGSTGGAGGFVGATVTVTPNETLQIRIGGGGAGYVTRTGGVNGGGNGASYGGTTAAGGGGYSGVFRGTPSQGNALVVAGGGGGGGLNLALHGGGGGGTDGSGGSCASTLGATTSGPGGSSAGSGGPYGAALQGGVGASNDEVYAGAGGGGGYWGGGGGWTGGGSGCNGGGGSGYVISGATAVTRSQGSGTTPGNSSDPDRSGAADGAPNGNFAGDPGRVVVSWTGF